MDLQNINKVTTLEDYAKLTSILLADECSKQFQLNIIRTLRNLQTFELMYFNKFHKVGAASIILDRLLQASWPASLLEDGVCANELVPLIKYWLGSVRKHLTIEKPHWWKFLNILLDFIQKLPSHTTILTALVRHVGAMVLDLATRDGVPIEMRHKILICFKCITNAPREVKIEYKDKFDRYFQELARYMSSCGDVCVQFVIMEVLLRWVLPRDDRAVRRDVAARWLPPALYSRETVHDFVNRDWKFFIKDTRSFLNIHNKSNDNVVSILCYRLRVNNIAIKSSTRQRWLDINIETKRLSLMFDMPMYQMLQISRQEEHNLPALHMTEGNTEMVKMRSSSIKGFIIEVKVIDPLQMFPAPFLEGKHFVTMFFTADIDVDKVDSALRAIFDTKYTFAEDSGSLPLSRQDSSRISEIITDVETRFSYPSEPLGRKPLGSKPLYALTASSSNSANLYETFIADQVGQFNKAYQPRVSAESQLNTTNDVAESVEHHSCSSLSRIVAQPLRDPRTFTSPNSENTDRRKENNLVDSLNLIPELRVSIEKDTVIDLLAQEVFDQIPRSFLSTNPEDIRRENDKSLAIERETLNPDREIPTDKDIIVERLTKEVFDQFPRNVSSNLQNIQRENDKNLAKGRENLNRDREIPIDKDIIVERLSQEVFDQFPRNPSTNPENTQREKDKKLTKERENLNRDRKIPIDKDSIVERLSQEVFEYFSQNNNMSFQRNNVSSFTNAETNNVTIRQKHENGQQNRPIRRVIDESNHSVIENTYPTVDLKSKFEKEKAINEGTKHGNLRQAIFDDKTIETYFSQHFYEQIDTILAISPTLRKKINDSGASGNSVHLGSNKENQIEVDNCQYADNICVNEKQRNELNTNKAGIQKEPSNEITNINCENKVPTSKKNKSLKLLFPKNDQKASKTNSLPKKQRKPGKPLINENKESSTVSTDEVIETPLIQRVSKTNLLPKKRKKSPKTVINEKEQCSNVPTDEVIATPLMKRRRKLYSEKDNDLSRAGIRISETEEETRDSAFIVRENVQANPQSAATPYTELEKIRKNRPVRTFFKRKSSPRKEDLFDQLRAKVDYKNAVLVDMKSVNKTDRFNFTSSSEVDEDFEVMKTDTRTVKKTRRPRSKVTKRTRSKSKMQSEMVDERMRKGDPCHLNTSIVQELSAQETVTEVEPIHKKPRVDTLSECRDSDKETVPAKKSRKRNKKRANKINTKQDNHTSSGSSLPELEIETVQAFTEPVHSIINLDALTRNSYDNLQELNLAENVLKESEQVNNSIQLNTTNNRSQRTCSDRSYKKVTVVLDKFDIHNEKSISTLGKSPITAHGVHEESPPKIDDLNKTISPRRLEAEGLSEKTKGNYDQLLGYKDSTSEKHRRSKSCDKPKKPKILCVSVPRLPPSVLRKYSRESHEVKSADSSASQHSTNHVTLSELPKANNTKTKVRTSNETSPLLGRKPIQPISLKSSAKPQAKENADLNIGDTKSSTFERVKENRPSTSHPQRDESAEHEGVATSIYDWLQSNASAKPTTADTINDVIDTALHKIETLREIDHNAYLRLIAQLVNVFSEQEKLHSELRQRLRDVMEAAQVLYDKTAALDVVVQRNEAFIAESMKQTSDLHQRKNQEFTESSRELVEEMQAFRPRAHDADDEGV